jgi:hypothetical protein
MIASLRRVAPARFVRARLGLTPEIAGRCVAHRRIGDAADFRVTCVLAGRSEERGSHSTVLFASQSLTGFPEEGWRDWSSGAKARATAQANVQVEIIIDVGAEAFTPDGGLSGLAERQDPTPKRVAGENNVMKSRPVFLPKTRFGGHLRVPALALTTPSPVDGRRPRIFADGSLR